MKPSPMSRGSMMKITNWLRGMTPTWISPVLVATFAAMVLTGCFGSSSGGSSSKDRSSDGTGDGISDPSEDDRPSGVFLDSAVEGLSYVSGSISGLTDADGRFVYEANGRVRFEVGDIVIGETAGKPLITPIDLVDDGDIDHPTVINIARFLQTIDEDGDPSNGIRITEQVRNLAEGKSIDFAQSVDAFTDDGNVQIIVAELTAATTAGARSLVSGDVAQTHLSSSIWGYYAGTYSGTFRGDDSGTWSVDILPNGAIVGTAFSNVLNSDVAVSGSLQADGRLTFASGGTATGATFSGTVTGDFKTSGTWTGAGVDGTFSGQQTGTPIDDDADRGSTPSGSFTVTGTAAEGTYTPTPSATQVSGTRDSLFITWFDIEATTPLNPPWSLMARVPLEGSGASSVAMEHVFVLGSRFECDDRLLTVTTECSGVVSHDAAARTVTFADVVLVGPAAGDVLRLNGTLPY